MREQFSKHPAPIVLQLEGSRTGKSQRDIVTELRRVIVSGEAPPGSPIPVNDVAALFGVSPIPIRESLKTLIGEGLVEHRSNGRYFVAALTPAELSELYYVRSILEQAAIAKAVQVITDEQIAAIREQHLIIEEAIATNDGAALQTASREFHRRLVEPCAMPRLLNLFESTWNATEPFRVMQTTDHSTVVELHADHSMMLQALENRDSAHVLEIAERHNRTLEASISET